MPYSPFRKSLTPSSGMEANLNLEHRLPLNQDFKEVWESQIKHNITKQHNEPLNLNIMPPQNVLFGWGLGAIDIFPLCTHNLLWLLHRDQNRISNPVVSHILKVWNSIKKQGTLESSHHPLRIILYNPAFPPGLDFLNSFQHWLDKDLVLIHQLTNPEGPKFFATLQEDYGLPRSEVRYLQGKNYLLTQPARTDPTSLSLFQFGECYSKNPHRKVIITLLYTALPDDS